MKKLLLLLCALLAGVSGVWAQTVTWTSSVTSGTNFSTGWFTVSVPFNGTISSFTIALGSGTGGSPSTTRTDAKLAISSDLKSATTEFTSDDFVAISTNSCGTSDTNVTMNFSNEALVAGTTYYFYFVTEDNGVYTTINQRYNANPRTGAMSYGWVGNTSEAGHAYEFPFSCTMTPSGTRYRIQGIVPTDQSGCYLCSNSNDENKLHKTTITPSLTNTRYLWDATFSGGVKLQNVGNTHYIPEFTAKSANGSNVDYLSATTADDAVSFTVVNRADAGAGYITLKTQYNSENTWLNNYTKSNDYVGCHNSSPFVGDQFHFVQVKTVTFSTAVAVDGGDAVSTIYVATDGSDSFTLPSGYTYTIGGQTYYSALEAASAIAAAGTADISVEVQDCTTGKFRLQQCWRDNGSIDYYLYANTSDATDGNRLWKATTKASSITNANYVWQLQSSGSYLKIYNPTADRYISKAASASTQGSKVNALTTDNDADKAEPFNIIVANKSSVSAFNLKASTQPNIFLDSWTTSDNFVGWHTSATHYGAYFKLIPVKTVTFSSAIAVNGGNPVSTIHVATDGSDTFTLPSGFTYTFGGTKYVTPASAATAIAAAGTDDISVTVESVVTDLNDLSNSKKYKIVCNRGGLSTYTTSGNTYLASPIKTSLGVSAKDFAIISYGGHYYLYSVDDEKFVTYQSQKIAPLVDDIAGATATITFTETSTGSSVYVIKFNNDATKILNCAGDDEYTYGIAINSYSTLDNGNQYVIEEVDDFDPTDAIEKLEEYFSTVYETILTELKAVNWGLSTNRGKMNYYNFILFPYDGYAGNEMEYLESLETAGYSEENLQYVQALNANGVGYALNMPAAGKFYRIKGSTSNKYLASGLTSNKFSMTNATDASTIFYYDGTKLTNLGSGKCNGMNKNNWSWVTGANASVVAFHDGLTNGGYAIQSADDAGGTNGAYFSDYGSSGYADRGSGMSITSTTDVKYTHWYLEEVTSLPVTNSNRYTSFSAPVAVTIPSGCKAYIATEMEDNVVKMTEIDGSNIAANTGIIIGTGDGSAINFSFPIYTGDVLANTTGNMLSDNVVATDIARANNYFFGKLKNTTTYVFTTLSGDGATYTLPGFKAYLPNGSSSARLAIIWGDEDPTGISEINDERIELKDGKYYQNGKVVVVRNGIKYNVAGQIMK